MVLISSKIGGPKVAASKAMGAGRGVNGAGAASSRLQCSFIHSTLGPLIDHLNECSVPRHCMKIAESPRKYGWFATTHTAHLFIRLPDSG